MTLRHKLKWSLLLITLIFTAGLACRKPTPPGNAVNPMLAGEPEKYSATVVRLIEDGELREETTTRVVCSGEWRREEWTEAGAKRALIFRPDLGKSFLLDLDKQLYVETDLVQSDTKPNPKKPPPQTNQTVPATSESEAPAASSLQTVTNDFLTADFAEEPTYVETASLPDATQDGRACSVREQKATFGDGRVEITRIFRAQTLNGLIVKTEMESVAPARRIKITTARRDINLEIAADEFAVPAGFKKVERLVYR